MVSQTLLFIIVAALAIALVISVLVIIERNGRVKRLAGGFGNLRKEIVEEFNVAIYAGVTAFPSLFKFETEDGPDGETFLRVFLKRAGENIKLVQVFVPADVVCEEVDICYSGTGHVKVRVYELDPVFDKIEEFIKETAAKSRGVR